MSASIPLKQEVTEQLPWLFQDFGLRVVEDDFDPKSFGNSFVTLESTGLRVRFIRDRGQVSAEVASCSDPGRWWNLEHVCELIAGRSVEPGFELSSVGALLRNNFPALVEALGPKFSETKRELERKAEERKRAFLRRFSR
jgi:hypothetical protein